MTIVTWCPLVDSSPGRLLQPPHQAHWNPMRPIILLTIFTKTRTQLHHAPAADLSLGLSCLLRKMGIIILTWPGYPEPLGKQTERYVRRVSMGLRRPQTRAWEGTRTLSLTGPCGSVPSVVAAPWRQYPSALVGAGLPRMHLASLRAMKRQPFRAGLDKSQVMRDRSPVRRRGRRPLHGLPMGQAARLGGPTGSLGRGRHGKGRLS